MGGAAAGRRSLLLVTGLDQDALLDLLEHHASTASSIAWAVVLGLLAPALLLVATLVRAAPERKRLKRAVALTEQALLSTEPPGPGPAGVFGRVESVDGDAVAMQLRIHQTGVEQEKEGSWRHTWTEQRREVVAAPFVIAGAGGPLVRVEPDADTDLVGEPSLTEPMGPTERTRVVQVVPGDELYVLGEVTALVAPGGPPILRAPQGDRLLLSFEPPARRHRGRVMMHSVFAGIFGALLLLALALHLPFVLMVVSAEVGEGTIVATSIETWSNRGGTVACGVVVQRPDGYRMTGTLNGGRSRDQFRESPCEGRAQVGDRVPVVFVRDSAWLDHFGREPGVHHATLLLSAILLAVVVAGQALFAAMISRPDPRAPLHESGRGRLCDDVTA